MTRPEEAEALTLDGRYRLEEEVGSDVWGRTFRATRDRIERSFLVKVFSDDVVNHPEKSRSVRSEVERLGRLQHPNLLGAIDAGGGPQGVTYVAFEHVEGHALGDRETPLEEREVRWVLSCMSRAIRHVHAGGFVHGAVGPDTIFFRRLDDGFVAQLAGSRLMTHLGGRGTPSPLDDELGATMPDPSSDWLGLGLGLVWTISAALGGPWRTSSSSATSFALETVTRSKAYDRDLIKILRGLTSPEPRQRTRTAALILGGGSPAKHPLARVLAHG